jgi:hypothetical protein
MNTTGSKATNGVSPSQRQQYTLLNSPKAGVPSTSKLPFVILMIGVGIVVSLSWSDIGARMIPGCSTLPKSEHIAYDESIERQDGAHIRKHTANVSLPLIWLMSFPASATFVLRVDDEVLAYSFKHILSSYSFKNSGTSYTSYLVRTVTGKDTATNYGREHLKKDGTSEHVFQDVPGGPFWTTPLRDDDYRPKRGYLLTKTHCGSRCDVCGPGEFVARIRHIGLKVDDPYCHLSRVAPVIVVWRPPS